MSSGLRVATAFLGIALCALSIMLNFQLYTSLVGSSNLEKFSYQYIGVALDFSKVVCLLLAVYLWFGVGNSKSIMLGVFCFIFYVILSGISLSAGWGFGLKATQNGENERLQGSMAMQSIQGQVASAESKAEQYSQYANINSGALQSKLAVLEGELKGLQGDLAQCPRNWLTKCVRPTRAKIEAKQAEIMPIKQQLEGYTAYQGAMAHKTQLFSDMSNLDSSALQTEIVHPLFIAVGDLFDVDPRQAKQGLLLVSFIVLELLGSLFFAIGMMFKGGSNGSQLSTDFSAPSIAYVAKKTVDKGNPYQVTNRFKNSELGSLNSGFDSPLNETLNRVKTPRNDNEFEVKTPISDPPVKNRSHRAKGTPDTDTKGQANKRYEHVKKLVKSGQLKPSLYALTRLKYGGVSISKDVAKSYQQAMLAEGIIVQTAARNGKMTFKLAEVTA